MKKIFFISILILFSASAFSQIQPAPPIIAIEKLASRYLEVYNYTKCRQYFLVAGLKDCKGCNQNQEDYLTGKFYMVPPMVDFENPGVLYIDGFNLFLNSDGEYIPAYISHVKIPHGGPPQCELAQIIGEIYCLTASTKVRFQDMMYCEIKCYPILATWKQIKGCDDGVARLTFTEDNGEGDNEP